MKISKNLKDTTTTQTEMARVLGITQQRVSQLVKEETIVRTENGAVVVIESLKNFYKSHSGESDENGELSLDHEKALHEKAKRELTEMKLAELKNEMHNTSDIELAVGGMVTVFKRQMLAIPYKMSPRIEGKNADEINEMLTEEINGALTALSSFDASKLGEAIDDEDTEENN